MSRTCLAWACSLALASMAVAQPPRAIAQLSMGLRISPTRAIDLGVPCRAVFDGSGNPRLAWAADPERPIPAPRERAAAAAWLEQHAATLGFRGFTPRWLRDGTWQDCSVSTFELVRDGIVLFDAEVSLYFDGDRCLGVLGCVPRIDAIPAVEAPRDGATSTFYARRDGGVDRIVLAELRKTVTATHAITEVVQGDEVLHRIYEQLHWAVQPIAATITEYSFSGMNFPDQIWADSKGLIWFSEPQVGRVSRFDPTANTFQSFPTPGYSGNDGLQVDDQDRVWFGLYTVDHGLGVIDATTGTFTRYAPPYAGAQMAIPTQTTEGTILVTDHVAERVSEFDPKTGTWRASIVLPPQTYPVAGTLEPESGDVWFTLYTYNGLGRWQPGATSITRIPSPSARGPAFAGVHDGKVYFTYWLSNRLGAYDTRTGTFTEYAWRTGENGGPMAMAPNGHAVVGTRNRGYIAVFDPVTQTFTDYVIPSLNAGLKDGLTVAPDGVVWFTLTFTHNKIAKLVLP